MSMASKRSSQKEHGPGFVYLATQRGRSRPVKIGMTTLHPDERALQLSKGTGVPYEVVVRWWWEVEDPAAAERECHVEFDEVRLTRISRRKEWFDVSMEDAMPRLQKVCRRHEAEPEAWMIAAAERAAGKRRALRDLFRILHQLEEAVAQARADPAAYAASLAAADEEERLWEELMRATSAPPE